MTTGAPPLCSLVANVTTVQDMTEYLKDILGRQDQFKIVTLPSEMIELQEFRIDLAMIDRLYHIENYRGLYFHLMARIINNKTDPKKRLFLDFWAYQPHNIMGEIFITSQPRIFFRYISWYVNYNKGAIYESMVNDGYNIHDCPRSPPYLSKNKVSTLELLCYKVVKENATGKLHHHRRVLPRILVEKLYDYIYVQEVYTIQRGIIQLNRA